MKQDVNPPKEDHEMEDEIVTTDNMTTDIVEDFARQLDQIVRLQDAQSDEEEEEEEVDNFGYQQLPQDDDEDMYQQLQSEDENEEDVCIDELKDPLDLELESSSRLNPETSDLIKSIMTNIQLSNDAIPEWAKKIPESAWLPRVSK